MRSSGAARTGGRRGRRTQDVAGDGGAHGRVTVDGGAHGVAGAGAHGRSPSFPSARASTSWQPCDTSRSGGGRRGRAHGKSTEMAARTGVAGDGALRRSLRPARTGVRRGRRRAREIARDGALGRSPGSARWRKAGGAPPWSEARVREGTGTGTGSTAAGDPTPADPR